MSLVARKKQNSNVKYQLHKEHIPKGTDVVHYIVPIEVNGRMTQEIPLSELEMNPGKYATMFPQYIRKIRTGSGVSIKPVGKDFKVQNGVVVKTTPRRTAADVNSVPVREAVKSVPTEKAAPEPIETATEDNGTKRRK